MKMVLHITGFYNVFISSSAYLHAGCEFSVLVHQHFLTCSMKIHCQNVCMKFGTETSIPEMNTQRQCV